MIYLALRDLGHDRFAFAFSVLGLGVLSFAFLLLIPVSLSITRTTDSGGTAQNLIVIEQNALQPEQSRIPQGLAARVGAILGDRLSRVDPVIFRILRIEGHPIQLRGVEFESWRTTFRLKLLEGTWPTNPSEVVIGQLAAQGAGWRIGSQIPIYGTRFRVSGIADGAGTKTQSVWMSYSSALALFGGDKGAQLLMVQLQPSADPIASREELENGLRSIGADFDVYFEDALLREYGAALNDLRSLSFVMTIIAIAAVTIGSHNLAWLAADERRRVFGVLRAMGFDRRAVGQYLLFRAGVISIIAYLLALAASMLFLEFGVGADTLNIGGTAFNLSLSPATAALGLVLACGASVAGTWLSARQVLDAPPASLLGRGPGSSLA